MKQMSQSFEVCSLVAEEQAGVEVTSRTIFDRHRGQYTLSAISAALSRLEASGIVRLVRREGRTRVFVVVSNRIEGLDFYKSPAVHNRPTGYKRRQDPRKVEAQEKRARLCLSVFREMGLIEKLTEDELWAELDRRYNQRSNNR